MSYKLKYYLITYNKPIVKVDDELKFDFDFSTHKAILISSDEEKLNENLFTFINIISDFYKTSNYKKYQNLPFIIKIKNYYKII